MFQTKQDRYSFVFIKIVKIISGSVSTRLHFWLSAFCLILYRYFLSGIRIRIHFIRIRIRIQGLKYTRILTQSLFSPQNCGFSWNFWSGSICGFGSGSWTLKNAYPDPDPCCLTAWLIFDGGWRACLERRRAPVSPSALQSSPSAGRSLWSVRYRYLIPRIVEPYLYSMLHGTSPSSNKRIRI